MSPTLCLEYACTSDEMEQAQSLHLRKQLGGGSKLRTNFILFVLIVGMLLGGWFRFREIREDYRALMLGTVIAGSVLFVFIKRRFVKSVPLPSQLEISERDITILHAGSKVVLPWSAFGEFLESPDLFVLVDRPKQTLIVVPKRSFPSAESQSWFQQLATNLPSPADVPWNDRPVFATPATSDQIALTVNLGFRDYLVCALTSWRTWAICLLMCGLQLGAFVYVAVNPPPDAVVSTSTVFFFFTLPLMVFMAVIMIAVVSVHSWYTAGKSGGVREIVFSSQSVAVTDTTGNAVVPWTNFEHYKETPWLFILWRRPFWLVIPKRAFASWNDVDRFRELLEQHLKYSSWFFGI